MSESEYIVLKEFIESGLPSNKFDYGIGNYLYEKYSKQINIEFPNPKTKNKWLLTNLGWVGYIPVSDNITLELHPKVSIENIFLMLEYAYKLKSFFFLKGILSCNTIQDFYERLVNLLLNKVYDRLNKGLYKEYSSRTDCLPFICGRLDVNHMVRNSISISMKCKYEELSVDIDDNKILTWTLYIVSRSNICNSDTLRRVNIAYRKMLNCTSQDHYSFNDCIGRLYNKLNCDYESLHALCRFFLEHKGPKIEIGGYKMIPFLVNMSRLFELFVSEWLKTNLPPQYEIKAQEKVTLDDDGVIYFSVDIILYHLPTNTVKCVIDTKYKSHNSPLQSDISQITTYALLVGCKEAILVYPSNMVNQLDTKIGDIRVRSLSFCLDNDLETSGQVFLNNLLN